MREKGKVLIIYTGGTIGMVHSDKDNPLTPLIPASWEQLKKLVPPFVQVDTEVRQMELIDSSDMTPCYWLDLASLIEQEYANYDGFVVLHGTIR